MWLTNQELEMHLVNKKKNHLFIEVGGLPLFSEAYLSWVSVTLKQVTVRGNNQKMIYWGIDQKITPNIKMV